MKLQIKTLARKQLVIEIDEQKTVYDLKREMSMFPDVGVAPEYQKLIYNGKILQNDDLLSVYEIDVKKFLVVMTLKKPETLESPKSTTPTSASPDVANNDAKATGSGTATTSTAAPTGDGAAPAAQVTANGSAPTNGEGEGSAGQSAPAASGAAATGQANTNGTAAALAERERLVAHITEMGYPEPDVRRALDASLNNAERAIEYLIEGIPENAQNGGIGTGAGAGAGDADMWEDLEDGDEVDPISLFRNDPLFQALRDAVLQDPSMIDVVIELICATNPDLLQLINENREDFLRAMIEEESADEEEEEE